MIRDAVDSVSAARAGDAAAAGRLHRAVGLMALLSLLHAVFRYLSRRALLTAARKVEREVRRRLFSHVIRLPLPFFHAHPDRGRDVPADERSFRRLAPPRAPACSCSRARSSPGCSLSVSCSASAPRSPGCRSWWGRWWCSFPGNTAAPSTGSTARPRSRSHR